MKGKVIPIVFGLLVIVLVLAVLESVLLAVLMFLTAAMAPVRQAGNAIPAGLICVLVAVAGIAAARALLRREPRPNVRAAFGVLALPALTGSLLFGLWRFTLTILPEPTTGPSVIIQYRLGQRDFRWFNPRLPRDLSGADLSGASLRQVDLSGADLSGANLSGANLWRANLSKANVSRADLSGAYVAGADLSGANLSSANLGEAFLSYANLKGAIVTAKQLAQVASLDHATMPDGTSHK